MLTLRAPQAETLWDELLPIDVKVLPEDLAKIDGLLSDPELLRPIAERWYSEVIETGRSVLSDGRPTIPIETYVRLMVIKQRSGWGYETLVREVSDSIHLRRFCLIPLHSRVPEESTIRKLTRRIGSQTVAELTRALIAKAQRERRFRARAARIDSTVIEADVRYPTDAGLAAEGVRALAREARKVRSLAGPKAKSIRDRSRAVGRRLRAISRTLARRSGERKAEVMRLTGECGALLRRSIAETRQLAAAINGRARGRGAKAKLRAARALSELAQRCERITEQISKRLSEEPIADRLVSLADPDARPIRKGKRGKPTEFGYVTQLCEVTQSTKPGARGLILPSASAPGNPAEDQLLPQTAAELQRAGIRLAEVALDGGFHPGPTAKAFEYSPPRRTFIAGRREPDSQHTRRRLGRYRTGAEGRISHLKRGYGLRRSRLKGIEGERIWTGWATFAYDLDTLAVLST
jgi:IS5 family transposase